MSNEMRHPDPASMSGENEIALYDILHLLRRRWWVVTLLTVATTIASAVYYTTRSESCSAQMLLDDKDYEIMFVTHTRALFPVWHHMSLGKSTQFIARVATRLVEEGVLDKVPEEPERLFRLDEMDNRIGPIEITSYMPSREAATAALLIWAEEYTAIVPRYRAAKLSHERKREQLSRRPLELERESVLAGLERNLSSEGAKERPNTLLVEAIKAKLMELRVEQIAQERSAAFSLNVQAELDRIAEGTALAEGAATEEPIQDAEACAAYLVLAGRNRLFSDPTPIEDSVSIPAKVAAMALTALIMSATIVVFVDWIRGESKAAHGSP